MNSGTELADALSASRSKAIAALGRAYVRREDEPDDALFQGLMHKMGLDDDVAISFLLHAWKVLREEKALPPGEQNGTPLEPVEDKATKAQLDYMDSLLRDKYNAVRDSEYPFTKAEATQAIDEIKAGTYDPAKYRVPF